MATTTNFGWETPDDTDLVKDGALAMRTLGNAIDASLVDLKGGTTGQVLSKNSNTDMDFTWVTTDDADAIQNSIVDAKGDLITATAADTPARLASSGVNGDVLTVDTSTASGLKWAAPTAGGDTFAAGKNKVINGDFFINQRNFSSTTSAGQFTFDRWKTAYLDGTTTYTSQTFTLGTAPVTGYEGKTFIQIASSGQVNAGSYACLDYRIEGVRSLANQTVTLSFWARATSGTPGVAANLYQIFGTGGSPSSAVTIAGQKTTISTSWTRYNFTYTVPSISGKTIGSNNDDCVLLRLWTSAGSSENTASNSLGLQNSTIQFWGVQLEAGNTATDFQTATGTLAGELAACQRYYWQPDQYTTSAAYVRTTTTGYCSINMLVPMRVAPSATYIAGDLRISSTSADFVGSSVSGLLASKESVLIQLTTGGGMTAGAGAIFFPITNSAIKLSAEL